MGDNGGNSTAGFTEGFFAFGSLVPLRCEKLMTSRLLFFLCRSGSGSWLAMLSSMTEMAGSSLTVGMGGGARVGNGGERSELSCRGVRDGARVGMGGNPG